MVTRELVGQIASALGEERLAILVTGGTGFVGGRLSEALSAAGHNVTVIGRNRYACPRGAEFRRVDLRNKAATIDSCEGQQFVIHAAADASPWKSVEQLHDVNVGGTENIIEGCLRHNVQRLIHVSSTSIHFNFRDAFDIAENAELPRRFACGYAESKARAEACVRQACDQGLNALIVRIRAVFGPKDTSLLPRLMRAYDEGKLRQIGKGQNITDLTHIDNAALALALALKRGPSGGVCTITDGSPIQLWDLVKEVLAASGRDRPLRQISPSIAFLYARLLEMRHALTSGTTGEPALTRYTVGLLAHSQTFSPLAATRLLQYQPIVPMETAVQSTIAALNKKCSSNAATSVKLQLHSTGYTSANLNIVEQGAARVRTRFHAAIGIIDHPTQGISLFDTGYSPRFYEAAKRWPYRFLTKATPVVCHDGVSAAAIVERSGIKREDVRRIIVSHFHVDHICGLIDFPNAEIIATQQAWDSIKGIRGLHAVRKAFLPGLLPADIRERLCLFSQFTDAGIGPFESCQDLFGDGSVRLLSLPGHASGQLGVLVQTGANSRRMLVADAVWTRRTVLENLKLTAAFRFIASDAAAATLTHAKLSEFSTRFPDVEIIPTHCPEVAKEFEFDRSITPPER